MLAPLSYLVPGFASHKNNNKTLTSHTSRFAQSSPPPSLQLHMSCTLPSIWWLQDHGSRRFADQAVAHTHNDTYVPTQCAASAGALRHQQAATSGSAPLKEYAFEMSTSSIRYGPGVTQELGMDVQNLGIKKLGVFTDKNVSIVAVLQYCCCIACMDLYMLLLYICS